VKHNHTHTSPAILMSQPDPCILISNTYVVLSLWHSASHTYISMLRQTAVLIHSPAAQDRHQQ